MLDRKPQPRLNESETELQAQLAVKEQRIAELVEQRDQLQERLEASCQCATRPHRRNKFSDREERRVGVVDGVGERLQLGRAALTAERRYAEGFSQGQHLAMLQEEGLVKQLRLLQAMQENLKYGIKGDKHRKFSFDDL